MISYSARFQMTQARWLGRGGFGRPDPAPADGPADGRMTRISRYRGWGFDSDRPELEPTRARTARPAVPFKFGGRRAGGGPEPSPARGPKTCQADPIPRSLPWACGQETGQKAPGASPPEWRAAAAGRLLSPDGLLLSQYVQMSVSGFSY
jgi:hypothetical protein